MCFTVFLRLYIRLENPGNTQVTIILIEIVRVVAIGPCWRYGKPCIRISSCYLSSAFHPILPFALRSYFFFLFPLWLRTPSLMQNIAVNEIEYKTLPSFQYSRRALFIFVQIQTEFRSVPCNKNIVSQIPSNVI